MIRTSVTLASLCFSLCAAAQSFPTKPVRIVVPFPPGGIDNQARSFGQKLSEDLGQPVVIDNRAGANGNIGTEHVARSPADGHTLLFTSSSTMVIGLFVQKNVPFDPFRDFTPVINVYESLQTLAVPSDLPVKNLQDLVALAKKSPGKLSYASSGVGSWVHLTGEVFKQVAGIDMVHVPYKGTGPMAADLAAGRVEVSFPSYSTALPFLNGNRVRIIALAENKRFPGMPDVQTIGENFPAFQRPPSWIAMFAPAGTPQPVIRRLNAGSQKSLDSPEVRASYGKANALIVGGTAEAFAATLKADWEITERLIKRIGIQPE
jgi:tripartite-type tricarboxylate transporter receptor subunit TctC